MFTRDRVHTSRERNIGRNNPDVHSVLAVFFQRNLAPADAGDGVSTYLALTFGTLLSSQGTDASFVLTRETLSGFPPGASLRSCVSDSIRPFRLRFPVGGTSLGFGLSPVGLSTFTTLADSPARFIIGLHGFEFGHAETPESTPLKGLY